MQLHERLAFGPRIWGDRLVIGTLDGTLLSMPLKGGELARLGDTP
ncbi:MAG: hypothetical protein NT069_33465 [Planctomycetota bacterium]|nr:hypothetical protein [Planctomycetota bacterium]